MNTFIFRPGPLFWFNLLPTMRHTTAVYYPHLFTGTCRRVAGTRGHKMCKIKAGGDWGLIAY